MCVKPSLGNLNPGPYPPHPTNIYTCGVTTSPRVRSGLLIFFVMKESIFLVKEVISYVCEIVFNSH